MDVFMDFYSCTHQFWPIKKNVNSSILSATECCVEELLIDTVGEGEGKESKQSSRLSDNDDDDELDNLGLNHQ